MLRKIAFSLALLFTLGLAACGAGPTASSSTTPVPAPADTALYRGTVTHMETTDEGTLLTLQQVPGTNFGIGSLVAVLNSDTRTNYEIARLEQGSYVEVYYGAELSGTLPDRVRAIASNLLPPAEASVHNGTLQEITLNEDGTARLLVASLNGNGDTLFLVNDESQVYVNLESLAIGDKLNILTNGTSADSLPPQATALELRLYAE